MKLKNVGLLIFLLCFSSGITGQELYLQVKKPSMLVASVESAFNPSDYKRYFADFALEYVPENDRVSVILNMAYAYNTFYPFKGLAYVNDEPSDYYESCFSFGVYGRWNIINRKFKLFGDLGVHYNMSSYDQVLRFKSYYGGYFEDYKKGVDHIFSFSHCVGVSLPMFWNLRYEPYVQFTWHSSGSANRYGEPLLAITPYYEGLDGNGRVFIWPFSFKIRLWEKKK